MLLFFSVIVLWLLCAALSHLSSLRRLGFTSSSIRTTVCRVRIYTVFVVFHISPVPRTSLRLIDVQLPRRNGLPRSNSRRSGGISGVQTSNSDNSRNTGTTASPTVSGSASVSASPHRSQRMNRTNPGR